MKAILTALICASVGLTVVAGDRMTAEEQAEYEAFGGLLRRPGTAKGQIVVVNGQQTVPEDVLRKTAERSATSRESAGDNATVDLLSPPVFLLATARRLDAIFSVHTAALALGGHINFPGWAYQARS